MWNNEPWACFSKDPSGKWQFDGFVEAEELAVEYEQLHMTEDDKPTGFTCQMPDLGEDKPEPTIKWNRFSSLDSWQDSQEVSMEIEFCNLTRHGVEVCVLHSVGNITFAPR